MIIHKTGNLFNSKMPAIGQGVNCRGRMGSGIAVDFRNMFPDMYEAYRHECLREDELRLRGGGLFPYESVEGLWILNLASQEEEGANAKYDFLEAAAEKAFVWCEENGVEGFALPRIGSGIGRLDEEKVEEILVRLAQMHLSVDLEIWTFKNP